MTSARRLAVYARQNGQDQPSLTPAQRRRYTKKQRREQATHLRSSS